MRCDALSFFNLNLAPVTQFLSLSAVYVRLAYTFLTLIEAICGLNLFLCSIFISLIFPLLFFCTNQFQFPFFSYFICAIKSGCWVHGGAKAYQVHARYRTLFIHVPIVDD